MPPAAMFPSGMFPLDLDPCRAGGVGSWEEPSAVVIHGVVAARVDAAISRLGDLVAGIVADVDDRLEEDGAAERVDRDAAPAQALLPLVGASPGVRAGPAARHDVVLADTVEDPARVGDQLVVGQRQELTE